ncbi:hypothetical protein FS837_007264 [Tulasnella sp. UAMH 9824]|nr:hypothetical protein FS837_007264 [Tulasnella sp. UAMH 9824]
MCDKPLRSFSEHALEELSEELLRLFTDLTARPEPAAFMSDFSSGGAVEAVPPRSPPLTKVGGQSTTSSKEDDDELASLFSSVLQKLNVLANTMGNNEQSRKFKREVAELNRRFTTSQAAVKRNIPAEIERRKRDPDLGWCYYGEDCEPRTRLESGRGSS